MIVIADTSPLNYVIQLGLLSDFHTLYRQVTIPNAVRDELIHPRSPEQVRSWAGSLPAWVQLQASRALDRTLPLELGPGEREAISLALENPGSLLLIDDLAGRIAAEQRAILFTGTLGFLLEAALIAPFDFDKKIRQLNQLGFRVAEPVLDDLKRRFALRQQDKKLT